MREQDHINFQRIAKAIEYIKQNFRGQPNLEEVAEHIHLSPFHFQKLFTDWAGISPKKFLQYISVEYAKAILKNQGDTLFDTALKTGLSGTGRLHDLFVKIEGMTPGEYKNGGKNLRISYSFSHSPFGKILIASTTKGVCHMAFTNSEKEAMDGLKTRFPHALYISTQDDVHRNALKIFDARNTPTDPIKLHLNGTGFQLKVWESLLKIPMGKLSTYGEIARDIENPKASRAVGTAIGSNPIAFLIPCHRVIQSSGIVGGYMWGGTRKTAMIGWEAAHFQRF